MNIYYYSTKEIKYIKSKVGRAGAEEGDSFGNLPAGEAIKGAGKFAFDLLTSGNLLKKYIGADHKPDRGVTFFLEPIPTDMASLFGGKHKHWTPGLELFEYRLEVKDSFVDMDVVKNKAYAGGFPFRLCGSKQAVDLIYNQQEWVWDGEMDPKLIKKYERELMALEKKLGFFAYWGLKGVTEAIKKGARPIKECVSDAITLMTEHKQEGLLYSSIAPNIPHLILYSGYAPIVYTEKKKITLS